MRGDGSLSPHAGLAVGGGSKPAVRLKNAIPLTVHPKLGFHMQALHLTIEGMTCDHCVRAVNDRLRATLGVDVRRVELGSADVAYDPAAITVDEIADLIADEGYTAFP